LNVRQLWEFLMAHPPEPGQTPEREGASAHDVTPAEEAARVAGDAVLTDAEKARLAAEASRDEDA
jgi:hypothetical protein